MIRAIFILFLFTGCSCYKGPVSEYGFFRKDIKPENFVIDERIYDIIDTTAVYERVGTFYLNEFYPHEKHKRGNVYLKFYANGKVSAFSEVGYDREKFLADPDYQLSRNDFDPAKSNMGYFFIYEDKLIFNFYYRHRNCYGYVSKSEFIIKNDTLIKRNIKSFESQEVFYVKKNIPIEFIEGWQPDW